MIRLSEMTDDAAMGAVQIQFDPYDRFDAEDAVALTTSIEQAGAKAEILSSTDARGFLGAETAITLIGVSSASAAVLAVIAAFLYDVFKAGVIVDLTGTSPRIRNANNLPRGTMLVLYADGRQELHDAASKRALSELMQAAMRGAK